MRIGRGNQGKLFSVAKGLGMRDSRTWDSRRRLSGRRAEMPALQKLDVLTRWAYPYSSASQTFDILATAKKLIGGAYEAIAPEIFF